MEFVLLRQDFISYLIFRIGGVKQHTKQTPLIHNMSKICEALLYEHDLMVSLHETPVSSYLLRVHVWDFKFHNNNILSLQLKYQF